MRLLLDTCAVIDLMTDPDSLGQGFKSLYDDPENIPYISAETERELVVHFNNKRLLSKYFENSDDMLWILQKHYGLRVLPVTDAVMHTYAQLELNLAQNHRDPSDHVIISHAITERLALLSSDEKFPFYRAQGLDLIEY